MKIGNKYFDLLNHTYIMGILNVTPDSFSDGGKYNSIDQALKQVEKMIAEGADIIDIGGESTRPGYTLLSDEEEISRVLPIIEAIKRNFDIPLSLDTYKSKVAKAGIDVGIDLINDIWGLKYDKEMASIIAKADIPCCLMHNRQNKDYNDFLKDVIADLQISIDIAIKAGIKKENIILDPGIGFAKTYEHNLIMLNNLKSLECLGYPMLLGASRKSVIGLTLDLPTEERVEGTITTSILAGLSNYSFVRVHDVKENKRALKVLAAIKGGGAL